MYDALSQGGWHWLDIVLDSMADLLVKSIEMPGNYVNTNDHDWWLVSNGL